MGERAWGALLGLALLFGGCSDKAEEPGPVAGAGGGGSSSGGSGAGGQVSGASGSSVGGSAAGGSNGGAGSGSAGLGTVGTGSVKCSGVDGGACAAGSVCCERAPFGDDTCEPSLAACADGLPVTCDEPADCAPQKCCAKRPDGVGTAAHLGVACKSTCSAAEDRIVCTTNEDCQGAGACMQSGDAALKLCF